jgi:hypothetical protein
MDRSERTLNVVKALNSFNSGILSKSELLDEVCYFFDFIKHEELDDSDKRFLLYLSNKAGIPQYYDILGKFNQNYLSSIEDENIGLNTFSSLLYESSLYADENSKLHQYQMDILKLFEKEKQNRFFLSASTSFGKTHLVYEVIKKMRYNNVALIFPSIALLTENLSKIKEGRITFQINYKIHTLSDIDNDYGENNLFIFTPERFLSFLDKNLDTLILDFIFVDEVYKIDNGYIIDNEAKENERDIAYRMAIFYGLAKYINIDILLAGPYIEIFDESSEKYNPSFDLFLNNYKILKLIRNEYEIVKVTKHEVQDIKGVYEIDKIILDFSHKKTKRAKIQEILDKISLNKENAIVYCNTQSNAEKVAQEYETGKVNSQTFNLFLEHLRSRFDNTWVVIQSIEKGIGVHHGVVPKYIQKEIVNLFNAKEHGVNFLVSTTTITEGVNTTAKNMIVYKSEKGSGKYGKPLLTFDAKNIAGRAGRFMEHYTGRVISLDREFIDVINNVGDQIKHKNYDLGVDKKEIDDEMTPHEFLDDRSKLRLEEIRNLQHVRNIPESILSQFKVISKRDKIKVYDGINALPELFHLRIRKLISRLNSPKMGIDKDGFQVVLDLIFDIIENENLKALIENKFKDNYTPNSYSILFASLNSYLNNGFQGVYQYILTSERKTGNKNAVNTAMRKTSTLIFNTYKYQLVKYLGVFNLMYKFWDSQKRQMNFIDVPGIDKLLVKLEYNAFSEAARIASDYGVPQKIIDYYDSNTVAESNKILNSFDGYENEIYQKIKKIIEE